MELTPFIENTYRLINKTFYPLLQILLLSQENYFFLKFPQGSFDILVPQTVYQWI